MTKLSSYKDLKWFKSLGTMTASYDKYYIELRWLDKKEYSCWIYEIDKSQTSEFKVLFNQNDDIISYEQAQTIAIQQLNKLLL